jgi:hypothetical protein
MLTASGKFFSPAKNDISQLSHIGQLERGAASRVPISVGYRTARASQERENLNDF